MNFAQLLYAKAQQASKIYTRSALGRVEHSTVALTGTIF